MNFKSVLFIIICFSFSFLSEAQKPVFKNLKITYTQLPLKPLNKTIKSYSSELIIDITTENGDIDKLKNQYLKLEGYDKAETGDIHIIAEFGEFKVHKELITENVYNVNQGKNLTGYYYKIKCEYPVTLNLKDLAGELLFQETIIHNENQMNFDIGKWSYSTGELDSKLNEEKEKFTDLKNKFDKKSLSEIKNLLESNFSYVEKTKKIKIATGKAKKHDYSDLNEAVDIMENAFIMISGLSDKEKETEEFKKAISIWEKALNESSHDKKARINEEITTMLYYNLSIAYWWMEDFNKSIEYAQSALINNTNSNKPSQQNKKLINKTIEMIKDHKTRLKIHGLI